jgi:hypothetical protein
MRFLLFLMLFAFASLVSLDTASADPQATDRNYSTIADATPVAYIARVCCKRGRHDWWTTQHACWRSGGYRVANWQCRNDWNDNRVCCKRGRYDWWTTARACRRSGGWQVSGWQCRNG